MSESGRHERPVHNIYDTNLMDIDWLTDGEMGELDRHWMFYGPWYVPMLILEQCRCSDCMRAQGVWIPDDLP